MDPTGEYVDSQESTQEEDVDLRSMAEDISAAFQLLRNGKLSDRILRATSSAAAPVSTTSPNHHRTSFAQQTPTSGSWRRDDEYLPAPCDDDNYAPRRRDMRDEIGQHNFHVTHRFHSSPQNAPSSSAYMPSPQPMASFGMLGSVVTASMKPPRPGHQHSSPPYYAANAGYVPPYYPQPTQSTHAMMQDGASYYGREYAPYHHAVPQWQQAAPQQQPAPQPYYYPNQQHVMAAPTVPLPRAPVVPPVGAEYVTASGHRYGSRGNPAAAATQASDNEFVSQRRQATTQRRLVVEEHVDWNCDAIAKTDFQSYQAAQAANRLAPSKHIMTSADYLSCHEPKSKTRWSFSPKLASGPQYLSSPTEKRPKTATMVDEFRHGYAWGSSTHLSTQQAVTRLCVASWPLEKVFKSSSVKIDMETATIELLNSRQLMDSDADGESGRSKHKLRRQFSFSEVLAGADADIRLRTLCSQRMKRCLFTPASTDKKTKSLVFLVSGCGVGSSVTDELPVNALLGDVGRFGLVAELLEDLFRLLYPTSYEYETHEYEVNKELDGVRRRSHQPAGMHDEYALQAKLMKEKTNARVVMSACVLKNDEIMDLLNPQSHQLLGLGRHSKVSRNDRPEGEDRCYVDVKSDGSATIRRCVRVQIASAPDFQCIAGMLLGRRAALRDVINAALKPNSGKDKLFPQQVLARAEGSWLSPAIQQCINTQTKVSDDDNESKRKDSGQETSDSDADKDISAQNVSKTAKEHTSGTLLLQFAVDYAANAGLSTTKQKMRLSFVCPCGPNWIRPGNPCAAKMCLAYSN
jgi:hypothetical protein